MKLLNIAAAGLIALTGIAPGIAAPAAAQRTVVTERTVVRHETVRHDNGRRYDRPQWRTRTVCKREWRNGHRARVCHQVRYRR